MTEPTLRDQLQQSLGTAYTIQRELGGGGMSRVFVARDEALGRDIVIKVLPRELAAEMSVERFAREIKLAAALQHPHVLPVLSAGASEGLPYYTMPFVRGESLRTAIDKGSLTLEQGLGVLQDVARALRYAHSEGVVHRDIKPENVLLSSGSAVVVDFGIAKALSASRTEAPGGTLTLVGTSIGTPAYMSPEQAAADPNIDHRADVYAWGVIAYEVLSGRHPFAGKQTPQQYLRAHLSETPPPLQKVAPAVPAAIAAIIMKALEKEPDARPQSADEIVSQLGGTTTSGSRQTLAAESKTAGWRLPAVAAVLILVFAGGFALLKARSEATGASPIMLAVLPFENQGPAEQDYFVDGLTDAVNGKLAGLPGISVIDRRSTLAYRKTTKPVKQIGSELGVQYVLGGVVRWARGNSGWRAQVMPSLVSTSDATTKWAGEPLIVSSDDPFSAQTEIATKVAGALQLALGANERRDLAERPTDNPDAYDAYLRGKSIFEATWRTSVSIRDLDQAASEFRRAVTLDPNFAQAWAMLANASMTRAYEVPGDTASYRIGMESAARAEALHSSDPTVVLVRSGAAFERGDRVGGRKIITDALAAGISSPQLLQSYAFDLYDVGKVDSANATMARAVTLNPRDADTRENAANLAALQKKWSEWEGHARAIISLDPTDERGWTELAQMGRNRGDTAAMRRAVEEAFRYIPSPSNLLLVFMVYAGDALGSRFVRMTPEQLRIETLMDSVSTYYDNKADFYLAKGDMARARIYLDSIIRKLESRNLSGPSEPRFRLYLANAYAWSGRLPEAQRELDRSRDAARALKQTDDAGEVLADRRLIAGVLGALGRHDEAVDNLRSFISKTPWTRVGLAREPKLRSLRGNPVYEAFLRERE